MLLLLVAANLLAQERVKPEDWPAHDRAGGTALAAEYTVHTLFRNGQSVLVRDHLVVEVAVFPRPGKQLLISSGQFTLRINGRKVPLAAQSPGMAAASLKYDDWEMRPTVVAGGGLGNAGVILGRPRSAERFPGDPRPRQERLPRPPQAPQTEDRSGIEKEPQPKPHEIVVEAALPEGEATGPVRGFLYFPFKRKPKDIRKLELLYSGPAGDAVLKLL